MQDQEQRQAGNQQLKLNTMPGSQGSFEDRIGKYKAGDTIIQGLADYAPSSPLISKAANTAFITAVDNVNVSVTTKEQTEKTKKNTRSLLSFTVYDSNPVVGILNPDCAQQRMIGVFSYLDSILPEDDKTLELIKTINRKIRPLYKGTASEKTFSIPAGQSITINNVITSTLAFNTGSVNLDWSEVGGTNPPETVNPGEETTILAPSGNILVQNGSNIKAAKFRVTIKTGKAQTNSPMEKTFASVVTFLTEVIALVGAIGGGLVYSPPDPKLTLAELTALRNQIDSLNSQVATAMKEFGNTNRDRKTLYDGLNGMVDRIAMIKAYLASFPGKKKSNNYIEFAQAIKGT